MRFQRDTPEVQNWIKSVLVDTDMEMHQVEGYSIKGELVTGVFERFNVNQPTSALDPRQLQVSVNRLIDAQRDEWLAKYQIAKELKVPLYLILWHDRTEEFILLTISLEGDTNNIDCQQVFNSCHDLSIWLKDLKGISVSKRFIEPGRLSFIDECLRGNRVPWPGNLDAFWFNTDIRKVLAIFEFSRTRKNPVETHDINQYFSKDFNRWRPLDILRRQLHVPLYLILWSSAETVVKIHEIGQIRYSGRQGLEYRTTILIEKDELMSFFHDLYAGLSTRC